MTADGLVGWALALALLGAAPAAGGRKAPGGTRGDMVTLLAYFRTEDEALHLAWSKDGLHWAALNGNRPLLRATVGNRSVRDPFIRRGRDGWYHLVCSDSWSSRRILHARSKDLVNWGPWDVVPAMEAVPGAQNAWAPEFVYDRRTGTYLVFWASVTAGSPDQHMWCCETPDFRTFGPARLLFDPGYSVIDATMVESRGTWTMVYKDERGENRQGTDNKAMRVATAPDPRGPWAVRPGLVTDPLTEGPTVFRVGGRWLMLYDHFLDARWGASESRDLVHWRPVAGLVVPPGARHGSVFAVPRAEFDRLCRLLEGPPAPP